MAFSGDDQQRAIDRIAACPFDTDLWPEALGLVAKAGGGWAGQLIAVSSAGKQLFNFFSALTDDDREEWEARGGANPAINPRARMFEQPQGAVKSDYDLASPEAIARNPFYQDFMNKRDYDFISLARVPVAQNLLVCAGSVRSGRQGHADQQDRDTLAVLLPHLAQAVRLQIRMGEDGTRIVRGTLEAASISALLCDAAGRLVAATALGERELSAQTLIRARRGRLEATSRVADEDFQAALRRACRRIEIQGAPAASTVILREANGAAVLAEVSPLPLDRFDMRTCAVAMVVLPARRPRTATAAILVAALGLTAAEAQIALLMMAGLAPAAISARRRSSVETVRTQIKALQRKVGVGSQISLVAKLYVLLGS